MEINGDGTAWALVLRARRTGLTCIISAAGAAQQTDGIHVSIRKGEVERKLVQERFAYVEFLIQTLTAFVTNEPGPKAASEHASDDDQHGEIL